MSQPTPQPPASGTSGRSTGGIGLVVASIVSVQVGAAVAKHTFTLVTPLGMTWLRLTGAAIVLGVARAVASRRTGGPGGSGPRQWRWEVFYAAAMVGMNAGIYEAFRRLPVGLAVTVEFLGPLAVGAMGARRPRDLAWPVLALAGVTLLGFTPTRPDPVGIAFALVAAVCWGGYILAAQGVGRTWSAVDALLVACTLGSLATVVPAVAANRGALLHPSTVAVGITVGALSTALPLSLEMAALRSIPSRVFGVLMSLEPVAAALAALVLLGERLGLLDLVAMACVVVASIGATRSA